MSNPIQISVIIPVYNEEKNIPLIYNKLLQLFQKLELNYDILFVNDGSTDNSLEILRKISLADSRLKYLSFSRNFGHQVAVTAGLDHCNGDCVVIIDCDMQDPPELIEQLYAKYKEGYQVVYAKRKKRKGESWFKRITAKIFYRFMAKITSINIPLDTGDYRLIDKKIVENLKLMPEKHKFLRGQIAWLGFKQTSVEYERDERLHGSTGYTLRKMIRFALDGITAFSNYPLKVATIIGFIVSFIAFCVILYALYSKFVLHEAVTGWTSLIISSMFIGGIQLITIGIIGEYISRINTEVKNRPLYIVEETNISKSEKS